MKGKMLTDRLRRIAVANAEPERMALRWVYRNRNVPSDIRMLAGFKLSEMPRNTCATRLHPRCVQTGRAKAVVMDLHVSRHVFREHALAGQIEGVIKACW